MIDGISRFWLLCNKDFNSHRVILLTDGSAKISGSYLELPEYRQMLRHIADNTRSQNIDVPRKVYFTRTRFRQALEKETGEKYIERVFAENCYAVMSPERMPLYEQIAVFRKAEEVACVNGTIPLNIIFARPGLKLTVINKCSLAHANLLKVCGMTGIEPVYIDAYYEPFNNIPANLGTGPFWIVVNENVRKYFADRNMSISVASPSMLRGWCAYIARLVIVRVKMSGLYKLLSKIFHGIKPLLARRIITRAGRFSTAAR